MVRIKAKLKVRRSAYRLEVKGKLVLPFASRQARGLKAKLDSGEEVVLDLPPGDVLRGGDLVTASDGRVIEVAASAERLLHAAFASTADLAKAAYRLGARHAPVEFHADGLRVTADAGVAEMLKGMGATLNEVESPFEPELEAHAGARDRHDHEHGHHGHDHHHHHGHDHKRHEH